MITHPDFSVVTKNRKQSEGSWKWEIYRAGRRSAIRVSPGTFDTATEAKRSGTDALALMLSDYHD